MRVHIDGTTHPIHDDAISLSATFSSEDDGSVEVQVAHIVNRGDYLHVVAGGEVEQWVDDRGFTHLRVYPTKAE